MLQYVFIIFYLSYMYFYILKKKTKIVQDILLLKRYTMPIEIERAEMVI